VLFISKSGTPAVLNEEDIIYADNFGPGSSRQVRRTRPHHRRALAGGGIEYYHTIGGGDSDGNNESSNVESTTTKQSSKSGGLSVFSIHQAMGGEVEVNPYPIIGGSNNDGGETMQVFSSTPFHPRQFKTTAGTGTEYIHYKNSKEKDGYGDSTFPPTTVDFEGYPTYSPISDTFAPIEAMYGWFQPTVTPSVVPTSTMTEGVDATVDELFPHDEEEDEDETKRPTKTPTKRPMKDPTPEPTKLPTKDPTPEVSIIYYHNGHGKPLFFDLIHNNLTHYLLLLLLYLLYIYNNKRTHTANERTNERANETSNEEYNARTNQDEISWSGRNTRTHQDENT
jgi:hypothetical protein